MKTLTTLLAAYTTFTILIYIIANEVGEFSWLASAAVVALVVLTTVFKVGLEKVLAGEEREGREV